MNQTDAPIRRSMAPAANIELRGVRVHNLKNVDVDIPLHRLTVISGVSGSGKSSLAFDTLYAEGQRRYIESFSAYARQFLDRLQKPDADRIDAIPPAIAIRQHTGSLNSRSTVATATEIHDHLRLLFARIGRVVCTNCGKPVACDSVDDISRSIRQLPHGTRFQICFVPQVTAETAGDSVDLVADLIAGGFTRAIVESATVTLSADVATGVLPAFVIVDRLVAGSATDDRVADSLEQALADGHGSCAILVENATDHDDPATSDGSTAAERLVVDNRRWNVERFSERLVCGTCHTAYTRPEPRLFSFNSPLGACPQCEGFGSVAGFSIDRLVPNHDLTIRGGAIAAWAIPAYRHNLDTLIALADELEIPVDVPFRELGQQHVALLRDGIPGRDFDGLNGFFRQLEQQRQHAGVRGFLNRWRSWELCPLCRGQRLNRDALAVRIGEANIADVCRLTVDEALTRLQGVINDPEQTTAAIAKPIVHEVCSRLDYLHNVGLHYVALDRSLATLSGGEAQRVSLTAALGSSLVNTLYVLDEPSAGLHPRDSQRVMDAIIRLRDEGNTVVVVEHEAMFLRRADHVIEIGPGAGRNGGTVVFAGSPQQLTNCNDSVTGRWLTDESARAAQPAHAVDASSGMSAVNDSAAPQAAQRMPRTPQNMIHLSGIEHNNLHRLSVDVPLGTLCVVAGVSGSGKSSLVHHTLYPAICRKLGINHDMERCGSVQSIDGVQHIRDVILVDQRPIGRSPRSIPVTYLKAFDDIRRVFAETPGAKLHNFSASMFSFNSKQGGRCPKCEGNGTITIDMQFLADVSMVCPDCGGSRFRPEVLDIKYRDRTIADVLEMTIDDAFSFFRTQRRLQKRLQFLKDVGLGYLPLGQPATTLSGGEAQRLKLAGHMAGVVASGVTATTRRSGDPRSGSPRSGGTLFLLDEPTTGLHAVDVDVLLNCFDHLLSIGHSLIVIEHNPEVIRRADYIIELGPGAGDAGGRIIAEGPIERILESAESVTKDFL